MKKEDFDAKNRLVKILGVSFVIALLVPVIQVLLGILRFGSISVISIPSLLLDLFLFTFGGFLTGLVFIVMFSSLTTRKSKIMLIIGFCLTFPIFILLGIMLGLIIPGPFVAIVAAFVHIGLYSPFFFISKFI